MSDGVLEAVKIGVTLLLGGSGYAALHAFAVRPRIWRADRTRRTVPLIDAAYRAQVEQAMKAHGIPTCFCEVAWWNQGRRAGEGITIEVRVPGPVLTWEMSSPPEDLAAPWRCVVDPRAPTAPDVTLIRLEQARLMPKAECRLVIGFDSAVAGGTTNVRAYQGDRELPSVPDYSTASALVYSTILFGPPFAVAVVADRVVTGWLQRYGGGLTPDSWLFRSGEVVVAGGAFVLALWAMVKVFEAAFPKKIRW